MTTLVKAQMGVIRLTEASVMGRETIEEYLFWSLQLPMNCWW